MEYKLLLKEAKQSVTCEQAKSEDSEQIIPRTLDIRLLHNWSVIQVLQQNKKTTYWNKQKITIKIIYVL